MLVIVRGSLPHGITPVVGVGSFKLSVCVPPIILESGGRGKGDLLEP